MRLLLLILLTMAAAAAEPSATPPAEVGAVQRPVWVRKAFLEGTGATADDAALLLTYLSAGYDHRTPNRYRQLLAKGVGRIAALDPASLDLPVLALATTAIAEACAQADDPELRPQAERLLGNLRVRWVGELPRWLGRSGVFAGPEAALLVVRAIRAAQAGGLGVGDDLKTLRAIDLGTGEAAELARAGIAVCCGDPAPITDPATAQRWAASFDRWWKAGQTGWIEVALAVASRDGGAEWRLFHDDWSARLRALMIHEGSEAGQWPLAHHPLGTLYGTAQASRCMLIFYQAAHPEAAPGAKSGLEPTVDF